MKPLDALAQHGQSIWLDYLRRDMTRGGELVAELEQGVRGLTASASTFHRAFTETDVYATALGQLVAEPQRSAAEVYEALAIADIQEAADALRPVYDRTDRRDGYVSLEVPPSLARDADGTIEHARRLWAAVDRPNVMIKVPGTPEGLPALVELLGSGINIHVTLIFSRGAYHSIADAFIRGARQWVDAGGDPGQLASVASFVIRSLDAEVDKRLEALCVRTRDKTRLVRLEMLVGQAAVASAKLAYEIFQRMVDTPHWRKLAELGVRPQRLLWTQTGPCNAEDSDVRYVEQLVGPDTVNALSPDTLAAFRDHGRVPQPLTEGLEQARRVLGDLQDVGISMGDVTDELLERGVERLEDAMDGLLGTVAHRQRQHRGGRTNRLHAQLPPSLTKAVSNARSRWDDYGKTRALWDRNPALWTNSGEDGWLGWLDIVDRQRHRVAYFQQLAAKIAARGFEQVVLLGMGGSSLAAEVLARVYGVQPGSPELTILDSTDPVQIETAENSVNLRKTLFIASSKSGTTVESASLLAHFYARLQTVVGDNAASHFIAITDPGSELEAFAREHDLWILQHGTPDIGGRFSVFSSFGMVPATAMGLPAIEFLREAALMVGACGNAPACDNPGAELGLILGTAATRGRDKLTIITTPAIAPFGSWLEQLIAESTGKHGKAIIPHEREPLLDPHAYRDDRLFVYLRLSSTPHLDQDRAVASLADAGHPVVRIELDDAWSLSQEFFRWQFATAVAGAVMQLNPFDQPEVEASKAQTRLMTDAHGARTSLPSEAPLWSGGGLVLYANERNANALRRLVPDAPTAAEWLSVHLARLRPQDYMALLAHIPMTLEHERALHDIRSAVLEATGVATCVGFGPRFLHSTGQAYKGGGNNGVILQLTCDDASDLPVPGQRFTFGGLTAAQARSDFESMGQLGRRLLRVHLGSDVENGLRLVLAAVEAAFAIRRDDPGE